MDRQIVYIGEIPLDTDFLLTNKNAYMGLAKLSAAVFGTNTLFNGLVCAATSPASLAVNVGAGEIYSYVVVDSSAYGSIALDTAHSILKQGINLDSTGPLSTPAPSTGGDSINYLIQYGFSEVDGGSTVLPYYNSSNPSVPFTGPNNDATPQNTIRADSVNITVKAGAAATTGTQTTPSPDAGFTGAYVVTVANGQSTVTSGNITVLAGAPFLTTTLLQKIGQMFAEVSATDTGTSTAYVAALTPALTAYQQGETFFIKLSHTNTSTTPTINFNGLGAKTITLTSGAAVNIGDLVNGMVGIFSYDGTNFQLLNPATWASSFQIQNCSFTYQADTGSVNAYAATFVPAPTAYTTGMSVSLKITHTNTSTTPTLNLNSIGAVTIIRSSGGALNLGDLASGMIADFTYDGTNFQLLNPLMITSSSIPNGTVSLSQMANLAAHSLVGNTTGSSAAPSAVASDIFVQKINMNAFSGTYTPTAGMIFCIVECYGAGGGGGGAKGTNTNAAAGGGGGGGGYSISVLTAAQIGSSQTITIGSGGTAGSTSGGNGGAGGTTSLGSLCVANGGAGGTGDAGGTGIAVTAGGAGGTAGSVTAGTFSAGSNGNPGFRNNVTTVACPGEGGNSFFGGFSNGTQFCTLASLVTGTTGTTGSGGNGGAQVTDATGAAGGAGGGGVCIIKEFIGI